MFINIHTELASLMGQLFHFVLNLVEIYYLCTVTKQIKCHGISSVLRGCAYRPRRPAKGVTGKGVGQPVLPISEGFLAPRVSDPERGMRISSSSVLEGHSQLWRGTEEATTTAQYARIICFELCWFSDYVLVWKGNLVHRGDGCEIVTILILKMVGKWIFLSSWELASTDSVRGIDVAVVKTRTHSFMPMWTSIHW